LQQAILIGLMAVLGLALLMVMRAQGPEIGQAFVNGITCHMQRLGGFGGAPGTCGAGNTATRPADTFLADNHAPTTSAFTAPGGAGWLDAIQTGLDIVGLVPAFGEWADGINAVIYLARGDWVNAGLSVAAILPIGGQAFTVGNLGAKYGDEVIALARHGDEVVDGAGDLARRLPCVGAAPRGPVLALIMPLGIAKVGMAVNECDLPLLHRPSLTAEERDALNDTLERIRNSNTNGLHAHPYNNNGNLLPNKKGVRYTSYDVAPKPGTTNRGERRVVVGSDGRQYYTNTHYGDTGEIPFYRLKRIRRR
jgi:hypothetical protein